MLSYASSRFKNGQTKMCQPSRFLRDISPEYIKLVQGTSLGFDNHGFDPVDNYRSSFHSPAATFGTINPTAPKTVRPTAATDRWRTPPTPPSPRPASANAPVPSAPGEFSLHTIDEVREGMEIMHERFGHGKITALDTDPTGHKIVVLFSNVEQRKLMLKYARFKIIDN